ncbi:MAG: tetratricopeptide repeat protein [Cuspidothrix sp.]
MKFSLTAAMIFLTFGIPACVFSTSETALAQVPIPTSEEKITEAVYLNNQGESLVYKDIVGLEDLQAGLKLFQQSLAIFKKYGAKSGEGNSLVNIGYVYLRQGEYTKALDFFQSALAVRKVTKDRENEWISLAHIGEVYVNLVDYPQALEFYLPALNIIKELKKVNPQKAADLSINEKSLIAEIAAVYFRWGKYEKALNYYQQVLAIEQAANNRISAAKVFNNIGVVYVNLGKYSESLSSYQQALTIVQNYCYQEKLTCFYGTEAAILNNLSTAYFSLGQYPKSLEMAEKSAQIYQKFRTGEYQGTTSKEIKLLYNALGENYQALEQIPTRANVGDSFGQDVFQFQGQALNLNNIGQIYFSLGKYDQALNLYQQALNIYKENKYKLGIAATLNYIAQIYHHRGNYEQAIVFNQQALANYRELGDRTGEGITLSNIGQTYQKQKQYDQALGFYQQALTIHRQVNDQVSEAATLKFIGDVLFIKNEPQLAITFYKQSVNLTEKIRQNLRFVSTDIQQSYTDTVAERYRRLADLMLQRNRPVEAQQVVDLLKIQEINDFLGNKRGNSERIVNSANNNNQRVGNSSSPQTLPLLPEEVKISQKYSTIQNQAILLGKELTTLRRIHQNGRTPSQEKRIAELVKIEQATTAEFNKFIKSPDVIALTQQLSARVTEENLNLRRPDRRTR